MVEWYRVVTNPEPSVEVDSGVDAEPEENARALG